MRTLLVVLLPPAIHHLLAVLQVAERALQQLALERLVEAFQLALGLRVMGTAVADRDPQPHQPDLQG
ncbi:hypothetical protein D3C84_1179280 [compost metagenome]